MPVQAKTKTPVSGLRARLRTKAAPISEAETEPQTETKEEAKVVVSKGLATLVSEYHKTFTAGDSYWIKIVDYCQKQKTTRKELEVALVEIRGLKRLTALNEVSKIMKGVEHPDLIKRCREGKITVRQFRDMITKKQEGTEEKEDSVEDRTSKSLVRIAKNAIIDGRIAEEEFLELCTDAYSTAIDRIEKEEKRAQKKAEGNGETEGTEVEGEAEGEVEAEGEGEVEDEYAEEET
jgi:hypothetical protein